MGIRAVPTGSPPCSAGGFAAGTEMPSCRELTRTQPWTPGAPLGGGWGGVAAQAEIQGRGRGVHVCTLMHFHAFAGLPMTLALCADPRVCKALHIQVWGHPSPGVGTAAMDPCAWPRSRAAPCLCVCLCQRGSLWLGIAVPTPSWSGKVNRWGEA